MAAPTLRHCVLGAFTDEATDAQKEAMVQAMRAMAAKIPQICSLVVGLDAGLVPGNHGFAANVDFASAEDYQIYATHPEHVAVITNFIKPILKPGSRTAVQFALPPASLKYYIFGHPVLMSPSPDIHNTGFARNGAAHVYERFDTEDAAEVIRTVRGAGCGGGSVTIPHKESNPNPDPDPSPNPDPSPDPYPYLPLPLTLSLSLTRRA
jgi:hypothetical protein